MLTGQGTRPGTAVRPGPRRGGRGGAGGTGGSGGVPGRGPGPDGAGPTGTGWARGTAGGQAPGGPADGPSTWALAVLTLASAAGLFRVFSGWGWTGPVVLTVSVTHVALWALRRRRASQLVALPAALAVVVLMVIWTVFGSSTDYGFPAAHAWSSLAGSLSGLRHDFAQTVAPVAPTRPFETMAAGLGGLLAVLGDWAAFRWRSPLIAVLGSVAAFVGCSTAGLGGGRAWVVGAEVAAVCAFLLVDRCSTGDGRVWFAGVRSGEVTWALAGGAGLGVLALVAAVALTPALAARDGVGALGWRVGNGGGGGERIVPNPIVSLRTRLLKLSDTPVFAVASTQPSYWRLTSLDTFNGETWTASGAYRSFRSRLPGTAAARPGTRAVRATFQIQQLDSVWLPEQFDPVAVDGVRNVSYDPGSGSLIASSATSNGLEYSVDSVQHLDTLSASALEAAPPVRATAAVSPDLELPAVVDGPITQLAAQLTAGRATEYDKALAIQDYLRSSRFHYTLRPPSDGSGTQALYNFLFVSRQGYCQQFAGAFAVLARAAGLPTRLAVGFATGTPLPGGGYQVYDRDAHTWPEVYFGPHFGWLPFEPTPGFSVPGTSAYTGIQTPAGGGPVTVPTTAPAGSSVTAPPVHKGVTPTTARSTTTAAGAAGGSGSSGFPGWLVVLVAVPGAVVVWGSLNVALRAALRRRRRRRAEQAGPGAVILQLWAEICAELSWSGIERLPAETDDEFARRATADLHRRLIGGPARPEDRVSGLPALAGLAGRATFAPTVPPDLVAAARTAATQIRAALYAHTTRSDRLRRCLTLPPGRWGRLTRPFRPT